MSAPILAYLFGLILAVPVFVLVVVLAYMMVKLFLQWLIADDSTPTLPGGRVPFRTKSPKTAKG